MIKFTLVVVLYLNQMRNAYYSFAFVFCSALFWFFFNGFCVSSVHGFDPLRYNYYALNEPLISNELGRGYNIVNILTWIYWVYPSYIFFLAFLALLHYALSCVCTDTLKTCLYSTVAFLYVAQTGKDFICYSLVLSFFVLCSSKIYFKSLAVFVFLLILVLYIRPEFLIFLPLFFALTRLPFLRVLLTILALCLVYVALFSLPYYPHMEGTASFVENSALISELRVLSFENGYYSFALRLLMYSSAPILQLPINILKLVYSDSLQNYVFFETLMLVILIALSIKERTFKNLLKYSVVFSIPLALFTPFYHFRYIFILWPFFMAIPKIIKSKDFI